MQYLGGKARISTHVAKFIYSCVDTHTTYYEPFVGSGAILSEMHALGIPRYASDVQPDLILLFQAIQRGWVPPGNVSEYLYTHLRHMQPSALRGFVGFGCSWGGKFFGGYARNKRGDNYARAAQRSFIEQKPYIRDVVFTCAPYDALKPVGKAIIYCDPPYTQTTGYSTGSFDSFKFWRIVRDWSRQGHTVLVSEYTAPDDFTCVWEMVRSQNTRTRNGNEQRVERIFTYMINE